MENKMKTVLIIGTLDTKSEEIIYLKQRIQESDLDIIVLDNGILGEPKGIVPEISASETALAAGTTLKEVRKKPSRGLAVEEMLKGSVVLTEKLYKEGRIHGAISLGGAEGGVMAAASMQVLPPGFPKIVITPLASGFRSFDPFIGIRDIMVMHSLIDIAGINDISRTIFDNASSAICGMVHNYTPMEIRGDNFVAVTALGTVQRAVNVIFPLLREAGYEPIIFHASGVGGLVMEDMIVRKVFCGVLELALNELTEHLLGSLQDAGPHRLEATGKLGLPQLIVPGCVDFFVQGARDSIPQKWQDRKMYYHNPKYTLIRPNHEEMRLVASEICRKLNAANGPVRVVLPLSGMSIGGIKGGETYDPEGDKIFFETLKDGLRTNIHVIEENMHVNEEAFAKRVFNEFLKVMKGSFGDNR